MIGETTTTLTRTPPARPLAVDLDGTLIRTDLLHESALRLLKARPLTGLFVLAYWLLRGRAALKAKLARAVLLPPESLPYSVDFLAYLRAEHARGRRLVLATAADRVQAEAVAAHLGVFDEVLASDGAANLSGRAKGKALAQRFGERGFDYAGNAKVDLRVWAHAHDAVVVNGAGGLSASAAASALGLGPLFPRARGAGFRSVAKALRVHQWAKNALIFVPIAAAHHFDLATLQQGLLAFLSFSLLASSVYVLNDLMDLEDDRAHPRKRRRPFAAGDISIVGAAALGVASLSASVAIALTLAPLFWAALALYFAVTTAYTFWLKRRPMLDVMSLAGLYTMRILAGAAATGIVVSFWLLALSMFLFLSLALLKRYSELHLLRASGKEKTAGRGYLVADMAMMPALGGASGLMAVLVMALYTNQPTVWETYRHPQLLWLICPLMLYWVLRVWFIANRGEMHDDPVVFAIRDKVSLAIGAMVGGLALAAAL